MVCGHIVEMPLSPIYISAIGNDGSVMNEINTAAEGDIIGNELNRWDKCSWSCRDRQL